MSEYWICDCCGGKIEKAKDGWIEWIIFKDNEKEAGRDLRLVHHMPASPFDRPNGCQFDQNVEFAKDHGIVNDMSLEYFLGPNGLMQLLIFISENKLPKEEVLEMIKRLYIPGYEISRHHFDRAIEEGIFEPNRPKNFYLKSDIDATLKFLEKDSGSK